MSHIIKALSALALGLVLSTGASAQDEKPELTIYTYDSFAAEWGPGPLLKADFEATCNCMVSFVATDSSISALRRLQLEGDSSPADIILGLDTSVAAEAAATSQFAPHGVDTSALSVPNDWQSDLFVPFDYGYFAFVYDTQELPDAPGSFAEIANAPESLRIVIEDPRADTPGLGLVLWIKAAYGFRAPDVWEGLAPHVVIVAKGWSEAYSLFLNGEADMVLSYTTSPAYHAIAEDDPTKAAAIFEEGHYPQVEIAGIVEGSDNRDLAADFLAYLVSPEGQRHIPTTNWMFTVGDVTLPDGFTAPLPAEQVIMLPEEDILENRAEWIDEALSALR